MLTFRHPLAAICGVMLCAPGVAIDVDVEGDLPEDVKTNVASVSIIERLRSMDATEPRALRQLLRQLDGQVAAATEPFGYYNASVVTRVDGVAEAQKVVIDITLGEPVVVDDVKVTFDSPPDAEFSLGQPFPLAQGDPLVHSEYENAKRAIQAQLLESGYLDADLARHRVAVRRKDGLADVELHWSTGRRYRFGDVIFRDVQLKEEFLRRYVPFEAGEYYDQGEVLQLNVALLNSGYFDTVTISQGDATGDRVPIYIDVVPRPRDLYEVGLSYGTDSGPGVEFDWERRYVNSHGHSARAELALSAKRTRLESAYTVPRRHSADAHFAFGLAFLDEETDSNERRNASLSASRFGLWRGWRRTDAITLLVEDFEVGTQNDRTTLLIPSMSLSRTYTEDDELIPTRGHSWRATASGGTDSILSDTSFAQVSVIHKRIWPVGVHRLLARAEFGATWVDDFSKLPPSLRYFAGGDRSLRGFDYEALGPRDANGDVIGGEYLLLGSIEYEHHVRGPWRVAAFVDAGNAFSDGDRELEYGVGFGLRYATPIGLIRVDVASAISEPGNPIRLHLIVGPDL